MININITNIEDLIFSNGDAKSLFPEFRPYFDKWLLSYRIPALSSMRKEAMLDLLNSLNGSHVEKLARLFNDMIFVEKLDYHIIKNMDFPTDSNTIEGELTKHESYTNMALSRSADHVYITMWR